MKRIFATTAITIITIEANKNDVRFRNSALEEVDETYLKVRRDYEQQQSFSCQSLVRIVITIYIPRRRICREMPNFLLFTRSWIR
jgi:hypothetical protein